MTKVLAHMAVSLTEPHCAEFGFEECPAAIARWLDDVGSSPGGASDPFSNCSAPLDDGPIPPKALTL